MGLGFMGSRFRVKGLGLYAFRVYGFRGLWVCGCRGKGLGLREFRASASG